MTVRRVGREINWGRSDGDPLIRGYWVLNTYPDGVSRKKPRVRRVRLVFKQHEPVVHAAEWVLA